MKKYLLEVGKRGVNNFLNRFSLANYVGNIGCYGDITFAVNRFYLLTPNSVSSNIKNKIEKFENIGSEPYSEFARRELRTVVISFKLINDLISIEKTINRLTEMTENGECYPLIMAGKPYAKNDFVLTNVAPKIIQADSFGKPEVAEISITLEEYVERITRSNAVKDVKKKVSSVYSEKNYLKKEAEYSNVEKDLYKNNGGF